MPIHRHTQSTESVFVLHGSLTEIFYNDQGVETERYELGVTYGSVGLQIPAGQWHTVVVKEPSVIFEAKDGAYVPSSPSDIMQL